MIAKWVSVFVLVALMDIVWANYMRAVADGRRVVASSWAVFVLIASGLATISYVNDYRLLVPASLGAFVGTFISVGRKQ